MNKDTNPKDALGIKKVPMHSVPCGPLLELGLAMMEGGRKYGSHNYRNLGVRASTYYDAFMRHLMSWWEGEDIDSDSNVHHVIKAIACLIVLRDSMLMGNWIDDRPIQYPNRLDIDTLNKQAAELIKKYPDCKGPFTEKNKGLPGPLINKIKPLLEEIERQDTLDDTSDDTSDDDILMNVKHPICPLNIHFEGDENKCNANKCDFDVELRECNCMCEQEQQIDKRDAFRGSGILLEHVASIPGWQIRLSNGMYLAAGFPTHYPINIQFQESIVPCYYKTEEEAREVIAAYLRSLK